MVDTVKQILKRPIQLADQVTKQADDTSSFRQDCLKIKAKTEKLEGLLRQAARASNGLYERPTRRIIDDTEQVLNKALELVFKCKANGLKRVFTIIPGGAIRKISQQLENSIGNVSWLLRVSTPGNDRDDEYLGLPPIAANEPILCLIWEQIAILCSGSLEDRSDAAASIVSLAYDNDRYRKLIIEEGGVAPLLKLAKEGKMEGQENAVRALGLLGRDPESVEHILNAGVCSVFARILKDGHMKVQAMVAWAVPELAAHHPKCQDHLAQNNVIWLLVNHLAYETIQEHNKYAIPSKQSMSIHTVVLANSDHESCKHNGGNKTEDQHHHHHQHIALTGDRIKSREFEDPATKAQMKAMAARALRFLCARNLTICRSITESRALLCFASLLEKRYGEVRYHSAMALMEITAIAEQNAEFRRSAFKPTDPVAKAVVDQFLRIMDEADTEILIPSIRSIGNLARSFTATETRIIGPLVRLLDNREPEVTSEAVIALNKFASTNNYLCVNHSRAIIDAGGADHLIQLIYFGEQTVQIPSLILLCYIAINIPDRLVLAQKDVLLVFEWATKQAQLMQVSRIEPLLAEGKKRLNLYDQSRG